MFGRVGWVVEKSVAHIYPRPSSCYQPFTAIFFCIFSLIFWQLGSLTAYSCWTRSLCDSFVAHFDWKEAAEAAAVAPGVVMAGGNGSEKSVHPDEPFLNFKLGNPPHDGPKPHKICRSPELEALNLRKGSSGHSSVSVRLSVWSSVCMYPIFCGI